MDLEKLQHAFDLIVSRAKREGLTVHHYPDQKIVIIRLPEPKPEDNPAAPAGA